MAKHNKTVGKRDCKIAESAKESAALRTLRIEGSQNGAKLRTRIVRDKTKYSRNIKHKQSLAFVKSLADARDFPFSELSKIVRADSFLQKNASYRLQGKEPTWIRCLLQHVYACRLRKPFLRT